MVYWSTITGFYVFDFSANYGKALGHIIASQVKTVNFKLRMYSSYEYEYIDF